MGAARAWRRRVAACGMAGPLALALLMAFCGVQKPSLAAFAGPYWMRVRAVDNCPADEVQGAGRCDVCTSAALRHNRTARAQVMDLNITLANGVFTRGESTMTLDVAKWNSVSGWRDHFLVMALGELCFVYEDIATDIVKVMAELSGVPTKCPIADGHYSGRNARTQLAPLRHFPALPYGRYRVHTKFAFAKDAAKGAKGAKGGKGVKGQQRSCMKLVVDVVSKDGTR